MGNLQISRGPRTNRHVANWAAFLRTNGLSIIPIRTDGTKAPASWSLPNGDWGQYAKTPATDAEVSGWFPDDDGPAECGIGIVGGAVSGGLEVLDLDTWELVDPFRAKLEDLAPGLFGQLVKVRSPRPGLHAYYRIAGQARNQKLARRPVVENGKRAVKTLIETKGDGGYVLSPGCPAACHPLGHPYLRIAGPNFDAIPSLCPEEHAAILEVARSFDEIPIVAPTRRLLPVSRDTGCLAKPWEDFNLRASWSSILGPKGWVLVSVGQDGTEYWRRPESTSVHSAAAHPDPPSILRVFSANAYPLESCLEGGPGYTKFEAFKLLYCQGNFHDALWKIKRMGFGAPPSALSRSRPLRL